MSWMKIILFRLRTLILVTSRPMEWTNMPDNFLLKDTATILRFIKDMPGMVVPEFQVIVGILKPV